MTFGWRFSLAFNAWLGSDPAVTELHPARLICAKTA